MGRLLSGKIVKIIIYDEGRVNGGTKYDFPGPRWVPKLVSNKFDLFLPASTVCQELIFKLEVLVQSQ